MKKLTVKKIVAALHSEPKLRKAQPIEQYHEWWAYQMEFGDTKIPYHGPSRAEAKRIWRKSGGAHRATIWCSFAGNREALKVLR